MTTSLGPNPRPSSGLLARTALTPVVPGLNKSGGLRCALSPLWDRPLGVKAVRASRPEDGLGLGRN